nr:SgcJ/EcaC family oxidoreductase [Neobacillus sp. Marseille-Q6967]
MKQEIEKLYLLLIEAWNNRSAKGMAELFAVDGEMIGFDGSLVTGKDDIFDHLDPIFRDHPTAAFVTKIKNVRFLGSETAILRAIVGMVPPGKTDINPNVNAHQTLTAINVKGDWRIVLFQNTPAQFHGRPEFVEAMSDELRQVLK